MAVDMNKVALHLRLNMIEQRNTQLQTEKVCWTVLEHLYFGTDIHKYYMNQYFKIEFVSVNIILIPLHSN